MNKVYACHFLIGIASGTKSSKSTVIQWLFFKAGCMQGILLTDIRGKSVHDFFIREPEDFFQYQCANDYMPITRNISDKSVEEYKQSIKVYLEFLEVEKGVINEKVTFDSFTRENIKEFIAWLTEKNCSKHSKAPQK